MVSYSAFYFPKKIVVYPEVAQGESGLLSNFPLKRKMKSVFEVDYR
ncbi:hypothetical protein DDD_2531 [Nonlabens dokdonensis DSW-6]|uniref:Uncharacterized protein n=1 Tax=Nonlabens dokdonensis (strain DSM 17205 / KCTC 12402 / DSW-6) TaxID=592029 RepID=L7WFH8_NONDD|nr:hypothetical protein DDD_2531 [Nonlabens dokdonensis DSW-6]